MRTTRGQKGRQGKHFRGWQGEARAEAGPEGGGSPRQCAEDRTGGFSAGPQELPSLWGWEVKVLEHRAWELDISPDPILSTRCLSGYMGVLGLGGSEAWAESLSVPTPTSKLSDTPPPSPGKSKQ